MNVSNVFIFVLRVDPKVISASLVGLSTTVGAWLRGPIASWLPQESSEELILAASFRAVLPENVLVGFPAIFGYVLQGVIKVRVMGRITQVLSSDLKVWYSARLTIRDLPCRGSC